MNKQKMTIQELVTDAIDSLHRAVGKDVLFAKVPDKAFSLAIGKAIKAIEDTPVPARKQSSRREPQNFRSFT